MEILSVKANNFASYKELKFDFTKQGLTLIQGPTGSGKSTLCDLIPWGLFGKTSKNGAVSEILTWPGDKITTVVITMANGYVYTRSRGPKTGDNDLYWQTGVDDLQYGVSHRGKDLIDTQKLINQQLGIDYDLYLSSSYYHEFSQTAQFFITTAKNRRAICEQLVDLSLSKTLQLRASEEIKTKTQKGEQTHSAVRMLASGIEMLQRLQESENTKADFWNKNHSLAKDRALKSYEDFERKRKQIITKKCTTCNTVLAQPKEVYNREENPYLDSIKRLEIETNPHTGALKDYSEEIKAKTNELSDNKCIYGILVNEIEELGLLQEVISTFRSVAIEKTIKNVESNTNQLLSDFFDAEIRVDFDITQADKLEVSIFKDGNTCSYTQLSKGQRCLLKLCFGVAVMKAVANHHAIQPQQLFFDEAMDGLSEIFKEKAFKLLETLSQAYNSIFIVEHSENLKPLFSSSYNVELVNGSSVIAKA